MPVLQYRVKTSFSPGRRSDRVGGVGEDGPVRPRHVAVDGDGERAVASSRLVGAVGDAVGPGGGAVGDAVGGPARGAVRIAVGPARGAVRIAVGPACGAVRIAVGHGGGAVGVVSTGATVAAMGTAPVLVAATTVWSGSGAVTVGSPGCAIWTVGGVPVRIVVRISGGAIWVAASMLGSPGGAVLVVGWTVAPTRTVAVWPGIILDAVRPSCGTVWIVTRLGGAIGVAARVLGSPAGCILVIRAGISSTGTVVAMW